MFINIPYFLCNNSGMMTSSVSKLSSIFLKIFIKDKLIFIIYQNICKRFNKQVFAINIYKYFGFLKYMNTSHGFRIRMVVLIEIQQYGFKKYLRSFLKWCALLNQFIKKFHISQTTVDQCEIQKLIKMRDIHVLMVNLRLLRILHSIKIYFKYQRF